MVSDRNFSSKLRGFFVPLLSALIFVSSGCGGHSAAPDLTFLISSDVFINGGTTTSTISTGTQSFNLSDQTSHSTAFSNIYVPIAITSGNVTILRSGSQMFAGFYSATTATVIDPSGAHGQIPITTEGALTEDVAISSNSTIQLPVTNFNALSFSNGIAFTVSAHQISNNTQDQEMYTHMTQATLSSGTVPLVFTYQNGTFPSATDGTLILQCQNSTSSLTLNGYTGNGATSPSFTGSATGKQMPYTTATMSLLVKD